MPACTACHATKKAPEDCAACHPAITKDWKPGSHHENWKKRHGEVAREKGGATGDDCSICHTESTCSACHQSEKPESHNPFWHLRGHGIAAMIDRENCAACHEPTSCERCHAESKP